MQATLSVRRPTNPAPSKDVRGHSGARRTACVRRIYITLIIIVYCSHRFLYTLLFIYVLAAHTFGYLGAVSCLWYYIVTLMLFNSCNSYDTRKSLCSEGLRTEENCTPHLTPRREGGWWSEGRGDTLVQPCTCMCDPIYIYLSTARDWFNSTVRWWLR